MDKRTLIDVVRTIDRMKANVIILLVTDDYKEGFEEGWHTALDLLSNHLQKGIEADVSAMENKGSE